MARKEAYTLFAIIASKIGGHAKPLTPSATPINLAPNAMDLAKKKLRKLIYHSSANEAFSTDRIKEVSELIQSLDNDIYIKADALRSGLFQALRHFERLGRTFNEIKVELVETKKFWEFRKSSRAKLASALGDYNQVAQKIETLTNNRKEAAASLELMENQVAELKDDLEQLKSLATYIKRDMEVNTETLGSEKGDLVELRDDAKQLLLHYESMDIEEKCVAEKISQITKAYRDLVKDGVSLISSS